MQTQFTYIHGANLTLHVTANISKGRPATQWEPAEDSEVEIEEVTFFTCDNGKDVVELDFEIDDIVVAGESLTDLLEVAAMEQAA